MTDAAPRIFVAQSSLSEGQLDLSGEEAARAYRRGARPGTALVALDGSGWETLVEIDQATPEMCRGRIADRRLADERRTQISLYHALLHPADFRRLLTRATALGVAAITPIIADRSVVPTIGPDGQVTGQTEWQRLVRDAAESSGRGRRPEVGPPTLFSHAIDAASRSGTVLLIDARGIDIAAAAQGRPFSVDLFCPPPGGFTTEERARAESRGITAIAAPATGWDPVEPALAATAGLYEQFEPASDPPHP